MANQDGTSSAVSLELQIKRQHVRMVVDVSRYFSPDLEHWEKLLQVLSVDLEPVYIRGKDNNFMKICDALMAKGIIRYGSYDYLYEVISSIDERLAEIIKKASDEIKDIQSRGLSQAKQPKTEEGDKTKDRNPKLTPLIKTTKSTVGNQTSRPEIISTQALEDAKEVIRKNGMVIIQGASGDGKTMMCYQLLKWLMDGDNKDTGLSKDPLQLYNMSKWDDIVQPDSQIALFIDDVSGDIVEDLKRRKDSIQSAFCGKLNSRSNCLILNVRDEIFKSAQMSSCELFNDQYAIDLRGKNLITNEEKLEILHKYVPKIKDLSGGKETKIVKLAPEIGFPQCCRLYRDVPSLQSEGLDFFKNPVYFIEKALKKLPKECFASLLFLFLNEGSVRKGDLDPNSENIDKRKLDIVFHDIELSSEDKIRSLRRSLGEMLGSLVAKTKYVLLEDHDDDVFYKFSHDSIQDTVVLFYGNDTKIGFIENCPRRYLPCISTSENIPNRIVISSRNQHMYKRLLREFESVYSSKSDPESYLFYLRYRKYHSITSLDVWTDIQFLQGFIIWLSGQNVDKNLCQEMKLVLLNEACSSGLEECALCLLSEGVKPDKETLFCVVEGDSVSLLRQLLKLYESESRYKTLFCRVNFLCVRCLSGQNDNINLCHEIKLTLLNGACSSGSEECALFLLSEGVKPDKKTPFCVVKGGSVSLLRQLLEYDVTQTARLDESQSRYYGRNINVLQEACLFEREEMVTILCNTYPNLVHDADAWGQSTLHLVAQTGNCDIFKTVERIILKSLYRVEDEQHKCERVEGHVVHRCCVCAQYMCQLLSKYGQTVLHVSCKYSNMDVVKYLWESYPQLATSVDNDGWTALHVSCANSYMDVVKYLCESYPQLTTAVDNTGRTVLHVSCRVSNMDVVKYLCESYPQLATAVTNTGLTVLHVSCGSLLSNMAVVKILCKSYPQLITAVTNTGWHCLHFIARCKTDVNLFTECESVVKQYIISTGGKYDITTILTNQGESVLDLAKERAKYRGNPLYDYLVRLFGQQKQ